VQGHFLLSRVLVPNAVVLHIRARDATRGRPLPHAWLVLAATSLVLVLGTIVTGAGPHAGDTDVRRYGFDIRTVARLHGGAVWVAITLVALLAYRVRHRPEERRRIERPLTVWICVALAQGALGYIQYVSDVPAALVLFHVAGATAVWGITVWLVCASVGEAADERCALVDHGGEERADGADEVGEGICAPRGVLPERDDEEQHDDAEQDLLRAVEGKRHSGLQT
jgi:cytochrome c oxidase assembly protein subunit 15